MILSEIAGAVGGELYGNPDVEISGCASLESAGTGLIAYVEKGHVEFNAQNRPAALIVGTGVETSIDRIEVENPLLAFARTVELLYPETNPESGVHPTAVVDDSALVGEGTGIGCLSSVGAGSEIGRNCVIHSSVTIGRNCRIGNDCVIHPQAVIINGSILGNRVIIHSGTVIGSDGFKYVRDEAGKNMKVRHTGRVRIGDDVEVGANCAVDRAFLEETVLEDGVKLDNLIQIGHNVRVGAGSLIASQTGIAGSTIIGDNVILGGQVGVADHVNIPDNTIVAAQSGIIASLKSGGVYAGAPAIEIPKWRRMQAALIRLPELVKRVRKLEKKGEKS